MSTATSTEALRRPISVRFNMINDVYDPRSFTTLPQLLRRYQTPASTFVLCGDFLGGSQLSVTLQAAHVVPVLSAIGTDFVCLGNHEFDFGPTRLCSIISESPFPWLCANAVLSDSGDLLPGVLGTATIDYRHYFCAAQSNGLVHTCRHNDCIQTEHESARICAFCGIELHESIDAFVDLRVGLFSVITPSTPYISFPTDAVRFEDPIACAHRCAEQLSQQGCHFLVALTHQSMSEDVALVRALSNPSRPGAPLVALLGGHDHTPFAQIENGSLVFKAGQNANWLGVIDIHCDSLLRRDQSNPSSDDVDGALHRFQIVSHLAPTCEWSMVLNSNQPELVDKRCAEVLQSFERRAVEVEKELAIKSGLSNPAEPLFRVQDIRASSSSSAISVQADGGLSTRTELVRGRPPAAFAVLIADALAWHFSVQDRRSAAQMDSQSRIVGVINGGFIRGDSMYAPQHIVTVGDILRELPFPRVAVLVQLSAADLYAAIEQQLRGLPSQCGYTPHFSSAFQLVIDSRLPPGSRLLQLSVNGQAVQRDDRQSLHRVAMTEFMAGGGDQVDALLRGTILNVETEQVRVSTIVVLYLRSLNSQMRTGALLEISGAAPANFTDLAMKM